MEISIKFETRVKARDFDDDQGCRQYGAARMKSKLREMKMKMEMKGRKMLGEGEEGKPRCCLLAVKTCGGMWALQIGYGNERAGRQ